MGTIPAGVGGDTKLYMIARDRNIHVVGKGLACTGPTDKPALCPIKLTTTSGSDPWKDGREFDQAWDGDTATFFKSKTSSGGWTQGSFETSSIDQIEFWPRSGKTEYRERMQGAKFVGYDGNGAATVIAEMNEIPNDGEWTAIAVPKDKRGPYVSIRLQG